MLVRFLPPEPRCEECHGTCLDSARQHPRRDVGGIKLVMRERGLRVVASRLAMHERRRAQCGWANQVGRHDDRGARTTEPVDRAKLHEQIVRVLAIDERPHLVRLAGLEELRRPDAAHRKRLERDHALEPECSRAERPLAVQHEPVLRLPRRLVPELALLVVVTEKHVRVGRPGPRSRFPRTGAGCSPVHMNGGRGRHGILRRRGDAGEQNEDKDERRQTHQVRTDQFLPRKGSAAARRQNP